MTPAAPSNKLTPEAYIHRFYRHLAHPGEGVTFQVKEGESDLWIHTDVLREGRARHALSEIRKILTDYIQIYPAFKTSLTPLPLPLSCPDPLKGMFSAAKRAGVGPMAGVAGMIAQYVGQALLAEGASHVLVENGGDLFIHRPHASTTIGLFAGESPLSLRVGIRLPSSSTPLGLATSSGTVGPSLSFGKADAVCAVSPDATLADAVVTALGNKIQTPEDLEPTLSWGASLPGIVGLAAIVQSHFAAWGAIELVKL